MNKLTLTAERRWWMKQFERGGWTMGRPMSAGIKKWQDHTAALIKMGLLEADGYGLHRMTDAGREALSSLKGGE